MSQLRFLRYGKVYILPTYNGLVLLGLVMLSIICATSSGNNLLYLFSILLGLLVLFTMLQAHQNLNGLELDAMKPVLNPSNQSIFATFVVNNSDIRTRYSVQVQLPQFKTFQEQKYTPYGDNIDQSSQNIMSQFKPKNRGQYLINRAKITSTYPFGLWKVWMWNPVQSEAIIYPEPLGDLPVPFVAKDSGQGDSVFHEGGDDFSDLKKYMAGDNPNHIDWRSFARGRGIQVKKFTSGGIPTVNINMNTIDESNTEKKLMQMSKWLQICEKDQIPFHFRTPFIQLTQESRELSDSNLRTCWLHLACYNVEDEAAQ